MDSSQSSGRGRGRISTGRGSIGSSGRGHISTGRGSIRSGGRHGHGGGSSSPNTPSPSSVNSIRPSFSQLMVDEMWLGHPPPLSPIHPPIHPNAYMPFMSTAYMSSPSTHMPPPLTDRPPMYASTDIPNAQTDIPDAQTDIPETETPPVPEPQDIASSSSQRIGVRDPDGRIWIRPTDDSFEPEAVGRKITQIIKSKFENPSTVWSETTQEQRDYYFGEFKKNYKWDPSYDAEVKKIWEAKNTISLRRSMHGVRSGRDKGRWVPENVRSELERKWAEPSYIMRRKQGKKNRASQIGGSVHTGGSISVTQHHKRMKKKLGRAPIFGELFKYTHQKKSTGEFVDARSAEVFDTLNRLKEIASSHASNSTSSVADPSDENAIYLEAVGGMNAKGRVYGIGSEARRLRGTSATSRPSISQTDPDIEQSFQGAIAAVMAQIASLREELQDLRERQSQSRAQDPDCNVDEDDREDGNDETDRSYEDD